MDPPGPASYFEFKEDEPFFLPSFFDEELHAVMAKKIEDAEQNEAPFRTDENEPAHDEESSDNRFIPLIEDQNEGEVKNATKQVFDEIKASPKAIEHWKIIATTLSVPTSRIALLFKRNSTEKDLQSYSHRFHLINDNAWDLFSLLAGFKRGDIWMCTVAEDYLYHTPRPMGNIFDNPSIREKHAALEAAIKVKVLDQMPDKKKKFNARLKDLEAIAAQNEKFEHIFRQQQQAIQMLLMLHNKEKFNHDMVNYLRDTVGILSRKVDALQKLVSTLIDAMKL